MASEININSGSFIHFSLGIALNAPIPIPTHFHFAECSQLCEFSPMLKATRITLHMSLMIP